MNPLMVQNAYLHVGSSVQVFTLNAHHQMLNGRMPYVPNVANPLVLNNGMP
jgi:hypothetical protein